MSETHIEQVSIDVPNGWKITPGKQPRQAEPGEWYWPGFTEPRLQNPNQRDQTVCQYIILVPCIPLDTTTKEYRCEVWWQHQCGKAIQVLRHDGTWAPVSDPRWSWYGSVYRVAPTCKDEHGHPCYEADGQKVRVPE
jgi:hypothetical protein